MIDVAKTLRMVRGMLLEGWTFSDPDSRAALADLCTVCEAQRRRIDALEQELEQREGDAA